MRKDQRGVVDFMFVAVLVVLVAAAAFTLWQVNKADETVSDTAVNTSDTTVPVTADTDSTEAETEEASEESSTTSEQTETDILGYDLESYVAYTNEKHGLSFTYPGIWEVDDNSVQSDADYISLRATDESQPRAGSPTLFRLQFIKQDLSVENRRSVYSDNTANAGYSTAQEQGTFFGMDGYKFTHSYSDNKESDFFHYVVETPKGTTLEIHTSTQRFDTDKDAKFNTLAKEILNAATFSE